MGHAMAVLSSLALLMGLTDPQPALPVGGRTELVQESQKIGYSIGYQVGGDFRRQGVAINPEMVMRGVLDALAGSEPLMTEDEMERSLVWLQDRTRGAQEPRRQKHPRDP